MSSQALIDAEAACDVANTAVWDKQALLDSLLSAQDATWITYSKAANPDKAIALAAYNSTRSQLITLMNDILDARNTRAVLRDTRDGVRLAGD